MAGKEAFQDTNVSKLIFDGKTLDVRIDRSITDASINRTITGASTIELDVFDPDKVLLKNGLFDHEVDIDLDLHKFALVAVGKTGFNLDVTFEDWAVAQLRKITKPMKGNRAHMTRAQFAKKIVGQIPGNSKFKLVDFYSPELDIKQKLAKKTKSDTQSDADDKKQYGFPKKNTLKIKHGQASLEQLENIDLALQEATALNCDDFLKIVGIMVMIDESNAVNLSGGDGDSAGIFQQVPGWGTLKERTNVGISSGKFFRAAIIKQKKYPNATYAQLATWIQNPQVGAQGSNAAYYKAVDRWRDEAINIFSSWAGVEPPTSTTTGGGGVKVYEFHLGGAGHLHENGWQCLQRLAQEVDWRCYSVGNRIYFLPDRDLYKARAIDTLSEEQDEVDTIDFDFDTGKKVNHATITCHATRWIAPPGACVILEGVGPANGRWLVETISRSLFNNLTTISLVKPTPALKEPRATETKGNKNTGQLKEAGGLDGAAVVRLAFQWIGTKYKGRDSYVYGAGHTTYKHLLDDLITPPFDCSALVAYCWAKGGHVDLTGTVAQQIAKAKKTTWLQGTGGPPQGGWLEGDLLMPHDHHVNMSMGDGTMIGAHSPQMGISITAEYKTTFFWCRPEPNP